MQGAEADDEGGVAGVVEGVERKDVDWNKVQGLERNFANFTMAILQRLYAFDTCYTLFLYNSHCALL